LPPNPAAGAGSHPDGLAPLVARRRSGDVSVGAGCRAPAGRSVDRALLWWQAGLRPLRSRDLGGRRRL